MYLTMKKNLQLLLITLVLFGCSKSDDCTRTIDIPQFYVVNGQSHSYTATQEVPCDFDASSVTPVQIEPVIVENISYEVLQYQHAIDRTNDYEKLKFTIRLTNPNPYDVQGFTEITWEKNPTAKLYIYGSVGNGTGCASIAANSTCLLEYEAEGPILTDNQSVIDFPIATYYATN